MKRSSLTLTVGCAAFVLLQLSAHRVSADSDAKREHVELSWVRHADADSCMTAAELKQRIRQRLGRDPFGEPFEQQIEGYVARHGALWVADLVVHNRDSVRIGSRHLESASEDCHELEQAVVLTITLVIDPNAPQLAESAPATRATTHQPIRSAESSKSEIEAITRPTEIPKEPATGLVRQHVAPKAAAPIQPTTARAPRPHAYQPPVASDNTVGRSRLLVATSAASGILPGPTYGIAMRAELPIARHLQLETSAAFFPERVSFNQRTVVGYGLTALGVGGCYVTGRTITWLACAGGWLGVAHAIVYRGTPDRPGDRIWGSVRADLGYAVTQGIFAAEIRAFALLPVTRWDFTTSAGNSQFRQAVVAPGAEIAVGIRLP